MISLLIRFEVLHDEIPAKKKQAEEFSPEVIESKVHAICNVRNKIRQLCEDLSELDYVITVAHPGSLWVDI